MITKSPPFETLKIERLQALASVAVVAVVFLAGCNTIGRKGLEPVPASLPPRDTGDGALGTSASVEPVVFHRVEPEAVGGLSEARNGASMASAAVEFVDPINLKLTQDEAGSEEGSGGVAFATEIATQPVLSLELLEQMAVSNNPAIRQAAANAAEARGVFQQVGLKPNPTIGYFGQEIGNEGSAGQQGGFVSQVWVRGEKLASNRRVLAQDIAASNWQMQSQQQRILTDVRLSYFDALAAQRRIQLAKEFRQVVAEAVDLAEQKLEAEVGSRPDVLQSEIQLNEVDLAIQQANIDRTAAMQELAAICGVERLGAEGVAGEMQTGPVVDLDEESVFAQIQAGSPEIAVAKARLDRACANLERQRLQPIPNITTQFGLAGDDSTGDAFTNLQVSLPLPVHNKNQGNIRAANAEYCAASQNVERVRARIRRDLARTLGEYRNAEVVVAAYRDRILPNAKSVLELMQSAKDAGEFDFLRVLTARRAYFDASLKYVFAQAELAKARTRIDGQLLSDGLSQQFDFQGGDGLRGQALGGQ